MRRPAYTTNMSYFIRISLPKVIIYLTYNCGFCRNGILVTPWTCSQLSMITCCWRNPISIEFEHDDTVILCMRLHLLAWLAVGYAEFVRWNVFYSPPSKQPIFSKEKLFRRKVYMRHSFWFASRMQLISQMRFEKILILSCSVLRSRTGRRGFWFCSRHLVVEKHTRREQNMLNIW